MKINKYSQQVKLLLSVLPFVAIHKAFALKGGTAINFYELDMPRLSVDIDLVYIPIQPRIETLSNISESFNLISKAIKEKLGYAIEKEYFKYKDAVGNYRVTEYVIRLMIKSQNVVVKIEVSPTMRGTCYPVREMTPSNSVYEQFSSAVKIQVISYEELYAGKIAATLARQHPRDLFDIKMLFENGGITPNMMEALIVDISSNAKPMSDLLDPIPRDIKKAFISKFRGMPFRNVSVEELEKTRSVLIKTVHEKLTNNQKLFLLSLKENNPKYDLLSIPNVQELPAVRWKLMNINKMSVEVHQKSIDKLRKVLSLKS